MRTFLFRAVSLLLIAVGSLRAQAPSVGAASMGERKFARRMESAKMENNSILPQSVLDTTPRRPFDVLSYNVLLDWRSPFVSKTPRFSGTNEITIKVTASTDTIVLDAADMRIDTFWLNHQLQVATPQPDANEHLIIPLAQALRDSTRPLILKFAYTRTSLQDSGMYFYPKGTLSAGFYRNGNVQVIDTVEEDLAYTMSEPLDAHKWMPCMDLPYQKSASHLAIIVPVGESAQSNGTLDSTIENNDYSTTFFWTSDKPIVTYLMCATASHWKYWTQYYHRLANPNDSIPVGYYAWEADYDSASFYDAQAAVQNTPLMIKAFSERFGEYPFVKYSQVFVQPFLYGGMEHQTISMNHRDWLKGYEESGIAHELMHQWFGDKTTCETFRDIWLNEGFATHGEGIWAEAKAGKGAYDYTMASYAKDYFGDGAENNIPIYNPPIENVFDYATTYCKAACVLYMLRKVVNNDTLFFNALKDYSTAFAFTTANTAQWIDFMSRRLGMDLTEYADEWLYNPGHPIYQITWGQKQNSALAIQVTQQQTVRDHFTMPLEFSIYHGSAVDTIHELNTQRAETFVLNLPYQADSVQFDSSSVVVSLHTIQRNDAVAGVPIQKSASNLDLQLQATQSALACHFTPLAAPATLQVYNLLGQELYTSTLKQGMSNLDVPSVQWPSGSYIVRLQSGVDLAVRRIGLVR